jgi:hypothetical protein
MNMASRVGPRRRDGLDVKVVSLSVDDAATTREPIAKR